MDMNCYAERLFTSSFPI